MMLLNGCLPNGKALSLSHVSSNRNIALEIWTWWTRLEYFVTSSRKSNNNNNKGSWIYFGRNAARSCY